MIVQANNALLMAIVIVLATATTLRSQPAQKLSDRQHACDQAQTQAEITQCASEQYHKADARLNAVYRKALDSMQKDLSDAQIAKDADQTKHSLEAIEKLKAAEKVWIQYRDLHCEATRYQYEGGSISSTMWASCMEQTTLNRIEELKSVYEDEDRKLE